MKFLKFILLLLLASCVLEPKYSTPKIPVELSESTQPFQIKFADFFSDEKMRHIIELAVEHNKDIELASFNVETAMQTFNVKRADLFPTLSLNASDAAQGAPPAFTAFTPQNTYRANITLSAFELDFFGRLRSLKKAARQSFLATKEAQILMKSSIIAQTANAYLQLIADSNSLEITKNAIAEQEKKLNLLRQRKENGRASNVDILSEEITLETMKSSKTAYQKLTDQDLHLLMLLTGEFNEEKLKPYFAKVQIAGVKINEKLLANIPSSVLLQRPDIRQAELKLMAANANIGAVRAAFFPTISLTTATYGYTSRELSSLLSSQSWGFTPQISIPIFNMGRNRANLNIAKLQKKTEIVNYEKAIQTAFREFLDASTNYKSSNTQLEHSQNIVKMNEKMRGILEVQRAAGITDSIVLANASIKFLQARQLLVSQQKEKLANMVVIYKTMGFAN